MARSRNIKPGFYLNEQLASCSLLARFIFPGLWMVADREGRLEDRPLRLKAALLPYDNGDVNKLLQELHNEKLIIRYTIGNEKYIQIVNFLKHQNPHFKEAESIIPPPDGYEETQGNYPDEQDESPGLQYDSMAQKPGAFSHESDFHEGKTRLIPDSLLLIPDSHDPPSLHNNQQPVDNSEIASMICGQMASDSKIKNLDPSNKLLHELIAAGAKRSDFLEAAAAYQGRNMAYILAIVQRKLSEPDQSWRESDQSIIAKAKELKIGTTGKKRSELIQAIEAKLLDGRSVEG